MGYRVVVVGATGNVGREMLNILAERQFPLDEIAAVASPRSTGDLLDFGENGQELRVRNIEHFDFAGWDMALFAAGSAVSAQICSERRRPGRLHRDRQFVLVPDGSGRSPDRARGECRRHRRLSPQEHHRQPELLDRADGGGAEAAPRRRDDQAGGGRDLPIGLRRRQGGHGRIVRAEPQHLRRRRHRPVASSPSRSPSTSFPISTSSSTTARPRRNGRWWSRPRRSSTRRSR